MPRHLSKEITLCLFRVAQEALHNAVKYGATQFKVELTGIENEIRLVVKDAGAGFDVEEANKNRGFGLMSMQERIHLVHGKAFGQFRARAGDKDFRYHTAGW